MFGQAESTKINWASDDPTGHRWLLLLTPSLLSFFSRKSIYMQWHLLLCALCIFHMPLYVSAVCCYPLLPLEGRAGRLLDRQQNSHVLISLLRVVLILIKLSRCFYIISWLVYWPIASSNGWTSWENLSGDWGWGKKKTPLPFLKSCWWMLLFES